MESVQLTTDAHKPYLAAAEGAFGADVDYAMLIKLAPCPFAVVRIEARPALPLE